MANAKLEIYLSQKSSMSLDISNVLFEEFPDGYSLHADSGMALFIHKSDLVSQEATEDNKREFCFGTEDNTSKITVNWD